MIDLAIHAALAFLAGLFVETAFVVWFRSAAEFKAVQTALLSMAIGTAQVTCIVEIVSNAKLAGVALVLGYGCGAFIAVKLAASDARRAQKATTGVASRG